MTEIFDCADEEQRAAGIAAAAKAVLDGQLVVLPTDTVYGIGADAFRTAAVERLLAAKGRGRQMPPPVLVGSVRAAEALADDLGPYGRSLVSSANITGAPAATTVADAREQLGDEVAVYLDAGVSAVGTASTIVDLTGDMPRMLRSGAVPIGRLREVAAVAIE